MPGRKLLTLLAGVLFALLAAPGAMAAQQAITSPGPLTRIVASDQLNCQVYHQADGSTGEFYPTNDNGACGTFLLVGGQRYTPASVPAGQGAVQIPWTPVSQSGVTGSGTQADPYKIVTTVDAGTTGIRVVQTDSYVVGQESYRTDVQVNNNGTSGQSVRLWRAGDCFLQGSDVGYGKVDGNRIACVASQQPDARIEQWVPLTSGSHYYEAFYGSVWSQISANNAFNDTCGCNTFQDNGAGLSWDFTVPAGGSVTQSHLTSFSPTGKEPLSITKTADSSTADPGTQDGYTITVHNPNGDDLTGQITDTLPAGFSYVPGSTTGASEPAVNGQQLTFSNVSFPANSDKAIKFKVTVSQTPGDYYNEADGTVDGYTVIGTGPTAKITVNQPQQGGDGRMVSNAKRGGATFASIVDCSKDTANAKGRPFQIQWSNGGAKTFKATSYTAVSCFDDPSFTASPTPATTAFDTQTGTAAGTVNGASGYTLEWRLEDHGAPSADDAARLKVTRNSDGAVLLDVPLGKLSSGQNYALPPN